jgi:hypothetical protein
MFVKTKRKDLHNAMQSLRRLVSQRLKVRRFEDPVFEETFIRKQCLGRFTFKGDARSTQKLFEGRGFQAVVGMAADQQRVRLTKTFNYNGQVYTARVVIYPDLKRLHIIALCEPEPR